MRPWIAKRAQQGHCHQLLPELQAHDLDTYRYYLRADRALFYDILQCIKPRIEQHFSSVFRVLVALLSYVSVRYRLMFALLLATGMVYRTATMV